MAKIDDRAVDLWFRDLYSLQMIGDFFNCTRQAVKKWLNKRGIDTSKQKWDVICDGCGESFKRSRCQIRKNRKNYCDTECYYKALYNPDYNENRQGQRNARKIVDELMMSEGKRLMPDWVVHHEDSDTDNNDPPNLMAFASHSDHMRWHRVGGEESGVIPLWRGDQREGKKANAVSQEKVEEKQEAKEEIKIITRSRDVPEFIGSKPFFNPQPKKTKK